MTERLLERMTADDVAVAELRREPVDGPTLAAANLIVTAVRERGAEGLREQAERFGDVEPGAPMTIEPAALRRALDEIPAADRELLERTADRIGRFARAQLESLGAVDVPVPGGRAGQSVDPVERAGCYAPGGRYPLPSSVLMTAVTARTAGVDEVWVASPRPAPITLAAAAVAGADGFLAVGGAQGIAALAYGAGPVPSCDVVVGPGNRFVTAAKQLIAGRVGIDMLAGPSELAVLADGSADPALVAADLLAQAEHDPDAQPVLISTDEALLDSVEEELARQLADLRTAQEARAALGNGMGVLVDGLDAGIRVCDRLAPEHLELHVENPAGVAARCRHYGALFVGSAAAEVLGDYGAGPNHTLPTGGTARHTGGLSVLDFVRVRTWLRIDDPRAAAGLVDDSIRLAELEGLAGHARSAALRR